MLTLEQFRATRTQCDDLGEALQDCRWQHEAKPARGFLYVGCLYIENATPRVVMRKNRS